MAEQKEEYSEEVLKYLATMGMKPDKYKKIRLLVDSIVNTDPKPEPKALITKFGTECYGTFDAKAATKQAKKFLKTVYGSVEALIELGSQEALAKRAKSNSGHMRVVRLQNPVDGFQEKIGDYLLGEQIGEGATSKVYLGRVAPEKSGNGKPKECALKILKAGEKFSKASLQKEIAVLKALKHPNVNGMIDCFENVIYPDIVKKGTTTVMVLELATRGELYDYIHATGAFEEDLARWCFKGMMEGLNYCHGKNIAHRDLKPENVLLDGDYIVKLVDFGFARFFNEGKDKMTTRLGTPGYVAPEILRPKEAAKGYTLACDIFTMGVILFSLYSGFPPFREQKKSDWWWDKLSIGNFNLFWKAHEQAKKYEDEFKDLVSKMLTFDPSKRITGDKIMTHPWLGKPTCTQAEAAKRLEIRKVKVDQKHREAAKKAKQAPAIKERALGDHPPPIHHGYMPFHTYVTKFPAKQVEEHVAKQVVDNLFGTATQVECGLWVGDKVDEIDRDGNVLNEEEKDGAQGLEWTDLKFTLKFNNSNTGTEEKADDEGEEIEGLVCVRKHPTKKYTIGTGDKAKEEHFNIFMLKPYGDTVAKVTGGWDKRELWKKVVNQIILGSEVTSEVAGLIWAPEVEKKEKVTYSSMFVNDLDTVSGGSAPKPKTKATKPKPAAAAPDEAVNQGCLPKMACGLGGGTS